MRNTFLFNNSALPRPLLFLRRNSSCRRRITFLAPVPCWVFSSLCWEITRLVAQLQTTHFHQIFSPHYPGKPTVFSKLLCQSPRVQWTDHGRDVTEVEREDCGLCLTVCYQVRDPGPPPTVILSHHRQVSQAQPEETGETAARS